MPFPARLFAVVAHNGHRSPCALPPCPKKSIAEIRTEKLAELETKKAIDRAARVLDRLEGRIASYELQIKALTRRKQLACARFEYLEERIIARMAEAHLERADGFERHFLARPNPPKLDVVDERLIPDEYMSTKVISAPDKNAVKRALAEGADIAGVRLVQGVRLERK